MNKTRIDYVDYSWNPATGCSRGCEYCYAHRIAKRFGWSFQPTFHYDRLDEPLKHKKPARILVCSMGDLFDPGISLDEVSRVWKYMWLAKQHTYLVLTKRPERMLKFVKHYIGQEQAIWDHVWLGVSITNQAEANERIPVLLRTPAALRWVSVEPILGPVNLRRWINRDYACGCGGLCDPREPCPMRQSAPMLDWVVVGAQTGPGALVPRQRWVIDLLDQCGIARLATWQKDNLARCIAGPLVQELPRSPRPDVCPSCGWPSPHHDGDKCAL